MSCENHNILDVEGTSFITILSTTAGFILISPSFSQSYTDI